jgi:hypothetical protein
MADEWQLYRVSARVRPLPWHPKYYDWQFGVLCLWLFADSVDDAVERAKSILSVLPYEHVGTEVAVEKHFAQSAKHAVLQAIQEEAKQTGLALQLIACATGTDEEGFENILLDY